MMMAYSNLDFGFWFCHNAYDAPCALVGRALLDDDVPFRAMILSAALLFLIMTQVFYYALCALCPSLLCFCSCEALNSPERWFVQDVEEDEATTLRQTKETMKTSGTFDYQLYEDSTKHDDDDDSCPICLVEFQSKDALIRSVRCRHVFHSECLAMWLSYHSDCPCCRIKVLGSSNDDFSKEVLS